MRRQERINVILPESTGKAGSRHDAVVDEVQRRDLLRRVEDEVRGAPWIAELMEVNRAHERFDESQWSGSRHFVLTFHDETLECVAKWTVTRTAPGATMPEVLARLGAETL